MHLFNKRGKSMVAVMFYVLFGVILGGFFVIAVFMRVQDAVNDSTYHKRFYSRDLALLVDSLHASNGEFIVNYEIFIPDKMKLDTNLVFDRVFLTDRSNKPLDERSKTAFLFGYNEFVNVSNSSINKTPVRFQVIYENNSIRFDNVEIIEITFCPKVKKCSDYCKAVSKSKYCDEAEVAFCEQDPCGLEIEPTHKCVIKAKKREKMCDYDKPLYYS